jgi:tetratricopeptide (TPR) repeat protein
MNFLGHIFAGFLLLLFLAGMASSQKPGLDQARNIIEEMDKVAGTYFKAPKEEASKKPIIEKLHQTIDILNNVRKEKGDTYESAFLLARAYAMLYNLDLRGSFDNTVRYCTEAMEMDPKNQDPHLFLAIFFSNSGHPDAAIRSYQDALWVGGEKPSTGVLGGMAMTYLKQGNGLWAYNAAREYTKHYPRQGSMNMIMAAAQGMANKDLIETVDIHFASGGINYSNKGLEYSFEILPGWRVAQEVHDNENTPVMQEAFVLGLPQVKDEKGELIENALGVTVFRKQDAEEAKRFAESFLANMKGRFSKIIEQGPGWFVYETVNQGIVYKGRLEAKHHGEFVYIINFTATPGTYDKNVGNFRKWYATFRIG